MKAEEKKTPLTKLQQHKHCIEGNNELRKYSMRSRGKLYL